MKIVDDQACRQYIAQSKMSDPYVQPTDTQQNIVKSTNVQPIDTQKINSQIITNSQSNKQKLFKIKEGQILRYKKRLFSSNWKPAQLTLYPNYFVISSRRLASPALINCDKNSTLIVFGQQLDFIPKRPTPPNGNKIEHMLAIGLINHAYKGTQIIFYWFSLPSQIELINWVVGFQNSLHSNTTHRTKTSSDIQAVTNDIALNNVNNIANINYPMDVRPTNLNDDLSLPVLMANTTAFNPGLSTGFAAVGAAGLLAANAQYQALFDDQNIGTNSFMMDMMNNRKKIDGIFGDTNGYLGDDATVHMIDSSNNQFSNFSESAGFSSHNGNNLQSNNAVPIAEVAAILQAADFLDCGGNVDCGMDCAIDASGGDCSFADGGMSDFAFAFI